jgi:hypothetical protein
MHPLKRQWWFPITRATCTAAPLRPEEEVLLCCARVRMDTQTGARMRSLLQGEIDWHCLLAAARWHGLMPLLYWHLHALCSDLTPGPVLAELRARFVNNNARNLSLTAELIRILKLFEDQGIAALPFKGPVLATSIYGNLALRTFEDLDILVSERQIAEAELLLRAEGYLAAQEVPQSRMQSFRQLQYEAPFRHEGKSIWIELHWKITPAFFPFAIDMENVWRHAEWISLAGSRVRTLSAEDALLILCAHAGKHFWDKLEWVCGIAELLRIKPDMNWEWVLTQAHHWRSERVLLLGLLLTKDLADAPLPEVVLPRIRRDAALRRLAGEAKQRLFAGHAPQVTAVEHCRHQIRLTERRRDKIRLFFRMLFLPRYHDWICLNLPARLYFFYYPIRIFRLLWKCAQAPLSR